MTTLTSPHDLISAIPFLIGYHPTDSVVLVSLREGAVSMAMRIDYPDAFSAEDCDSLVHHLTRNGAHNALVVAYLPSEAKNEAEFFSALADSLQKAGICLDEALLVRNGRWRSTLCKDLECCPPEGQMVPDIGASRIAAEQVISGQAMPFASGEELAESLSPAPLSLDPDFVSKVSQSRIDPENPALRGAQKDGAIAVIDLASRFIAGTVGKDIVADQELSARVLGALTDIQVRDFALGSHTEATHQIYWQMWRYLLRIAPKGFVAPVATLFAATSYECGQGAISHRALDRAVEDDPTYSLTGLLRRVFSAGWPPESFAAMRKELHPKVCEGIFDNRGAALL